MNDYDEMLDWLLCTDRDRGGAGNVNGSNHEYNNMSPLQNSVNQDCCPATFDMSSASQLGPQLTLDELTSILDSPSSHDSMLVPDSMDPVELPHFQVDLADSLNFAATNSGCRDCKCTGRSGDSLKGKMKHCGAKSSTIEDARLWRRKNEPSRKQHNETERIRRDKFNKKIRTLQSLLPNSNKVDTASVLDGAIDYVKSLQLHVSEMLVTSMPSATPLGASTTGFQCPQHPQFGQLALRLNQGTCFDNSKPIVENSPSVLLVSSQAMAHSSLSRASTPPQFHGIPSLPRSLVHTPHAPVRLDYEGFRPVYWSPQVAAGVPPQPRHQQLPKPLQHMEENSRMQSEKQ